ncbi:MAG: hypothetical protein ACR2RB_06305 [Gammaproteobacteria bacterium]
METGNSFFTRIKKTRFERLYDQPDCRDYYRALSPLDYQIPTHVVPIARSVIEQLSRMRGLDVPRVLDVACGYGVAGALLRHNVTMREIFDRCIAPELEHADVDAVIAQDRAWYRTRRRAGCLLHISGLDVSASALDYAARVGLCDAVFTDNLEQDDANPALRSELGKVDLVIEMGGIGYIGTATFQRILDAARESLPWLVVAPTRVSDNEPTLRMLQSYGLVLERTPNSPFRHRRFTGDDERTSAIEEVRRKGLDPDGYERSGYYFADAYLARPAGECLSNSLPP